MELFRTPGGDAQQLQLIGTIARKTTLSGSIRRGRGGTGRTYLPPIAGAAGVLVRLKNPPFVFRATSLVADAEVSDIGPRGSARSVTRSAATASLTEVAIGRRRASISWRSCSFSRTQPLGQASRPSSAAEDHKPKFLAVLFQVQAQYFAGKPAGHWLDRHVLALRPIGTPGAEAPGNLRSGRRGSTRALSARRDRARALSSDLRGLSTWT